MLTLATIQDSYIIAAGDAAAAYFHRIYQSGATLHGAGATPVGEVLKSQWTVHHFQAVIVDPVTGRIYDGRYLRLLAGVSRDKGSQVDVTLSPVQGSGLVVAARTPFICEYGIGVQVHAPCTAGEELRILAIVEVVK